MGIIIHVVRDEKMIDIQTSKRCHLMKFFWSVHIISISYPAKIQCYYYNIILTPFIREISTFPFMLYSYKKSKIMEWGFYFYLVRKVPSNTAEPHPSPLKHHPPPYL